MNNNITFCSHSHNCSCSGGTHSYVPYYEKIINLIKPVNVFEWGPGKNTDIALQTESLKKIVSVEQDKRWIPTISDSRSCIIYCSQDSDFYVKGFENYWVENKFDLFFIDSRKRSECLETVYNYSLEHNLSTIVCLHDAQRERYRKALSKFRYVYFLHKGFAVATLCEKTFLKIKTYL